MLHAPHALPPAPPCPCPCPCLLLQEITDRVQSDYNGLETEFWDAAFTKIKELTESKNGDANDVLAQTMLTDLQVHS